MDSDRVLSDLDELARLTSDDLGAQRVCWSSGWSRAREHLEQLVAEIGLRSETDSAGNLWARLEGQEPDAPALALGSHLDSVPGGGWLDGALGVMAAVGVLREYAGAGAVPRRSLVLVDWADEEGVRFGRSLFGSSACAGTLLPEEFKGLTDQEGESAEHVLAKYGVELERVLESSRMLEGIGAYLELHVEQGPVLEDKGIAAAAVDGCFGVERARFDFTGQASHAGTTPMRFRKDALLAAAAAALAISRLPEQAGGVATTGSLSVEPGIPTAVPGRASMIADLRHPERDGLTELLEGARAACAEAASERGCGLAEHAAWAIEPVRFDTRLVQIVHKACESSSTESATLTSGAIHDAAAMAQVLPTAMLFAPSKRGLSHTPDEDTDRGDLAVALEAYSRACREVLANLD
jgi:N-carbamoyl-L-amino-acid hydrolase